MNASATAPPATADVAVYGTPLRLVATDESLLTRLLLRLPPSWAPARQRPGCRTYAAERDAGGSVTIRAAGEVLAAGDDEHALAAFGAELDAYVAEFAPAYVFVHAAVVGWRGRAVVLPGPSFSGKSTLAAELVRAGATYYSDEFAVLDRHGRVHAYPRPIAIRDSATGSRTDRPPESLDGVTGGPPLRVGLIGLTEYAASVVSWRPRRLTAGQAVLELLANTVSARRNPERALSVLTRLASRAIVVKGRRGDARTAALSVLRTAERARGGDARGV